MLVTKDCVNLVNNLAKCNSLKEFHWIYGNQLLKDKIMSSNNNLTIILLNKTEVIFVRATIQYLLFNSKGKIE